MSKANNGANLGFENKLWEMADKMRGHMDASEYKHVVLGLIFLKYISDAFQAKYDELAATAETEYTDPEDRTGLRIKAAPLFGFLVRHQGPADVFGVGEAAGLDAFVPGGFH